MFLNPGNNPRSQRSLCSHASRLPAREAYYFLTHEASAAASRAMSSVTGVGDDVGFDENFSEADPLLSISSSGAYLWPALLRVGTMLLCLMATLLACLYVICCRSRLRALCGVRVLLCLSMLLWVACALASRRSVWDLILVPLGVGLPAADEFELFCGVHSIVEYGVAEPLAMALIGLVFQAKARRSSAPPKRPWRIVRGAFAVSLLAGMLHAGLFIFDRYVPTQSVLGPQPRMRAPAQPPPSPLVSPVPAPPSAPDMGEGAGGATDAAWSAHRYRYRWWLAEGCGTTYGTVALTALFTICFEVAWTTACQRLASTVLNLKMRARLRLVQLTFTLVPLLLLLLRASLLLLPVHWPTFRRFLRDVELLVILLAVLAASWILVFRPVLEAAPAASSGSATHGPAPFVAAGIERDGSSPSRGSGDAPAATWSETRRLEAAAAWFSSFLRGAGRSSESSERGASIESHESPSPRSSGGGRNEGAGGTPKSASPWSSPLGGLLFLGIQPKAASRRPTLSVAVDLNDEAHTPSRDEPHGLQMVSVTPTIACAHACTSDAAQDDAPATPARIASRLERARSIGKSTPA